jgi:hypothetical protein
MKRQSKLTPQEELAAQEQQTQKAAPLEFAGVEELLRHDAEHTPVPPTIAQRIIESIEKAEAAPRPWWRRWLGK